MKKTCLSLALLALTVSPLAFAKDAHAEAGTWEIGLRAVSVLPENGGSTTIGGTPEADNSFVPEIDFSYFFTDHVAAELILAIAPHEASVKGSGSGDLDLGDALVSPATLNLQYHFMPDQQISPYVGAGINYTLMYSEDNGKDSNKLDVDNGFGYSLQAGVDYWLDDDFGLNFDVKKIWVEHDVSVNGGAVTGELELDPWIIGAGVTWRF